MNDIFQWVANLPPALQTLIVSHTEGNPFYVEELVKVLLDDGVIAKENEEQWRVVPDWLTDIQVPATLTGVLQARLDALPEPERECLKRAAVVGRFFWDQILAALYHDDNEAVTTESLHDLLAALRRKELIFQREHSAFARMQEYLFKHPLLQDITYEMVRRRQRRQYHAQAAAWLITASDERVEEYAGGIGEHYDKAPAAHVGSDLVSSRRKTGSGGVCPRHSDRLLSESIGFVG